MAKIEAYPERLQSSIQSEAELIHNLESLAGRVEDIRKNLGYKIAGRAQIAARLRDVSEQIVRESNAAQSMRDALERIANQYRRTENDNLGKLTTDDAQTRDRPSFPFAPVFPTGYIPFPFPNTPKPIPFPLPFSSPDWERLFDLTPLRDRGYLYKSLTLIPLNLLGAVVIGGMNGGIEMPRLKGGSSALSGGASVGGSLGGISASASAQGDLLGWSYDVSPSKVGIEGHVAKGEVSGALGLLSGSLGGSVGNIGAKGTLKAGLFDDDGKFTPGLNLSGKAGVSVLSGEAGVKFGSDAFNGHGKAEGKVLSASVKGEVGAGVLTKEKNGKEINVLGVKGEVGAEANVAQGELSGGFSLFGIDIDASVSGKIGAGAKAGGSVTTSGLSLDLGAALGLGAGISIDIDWSGFKFGW